MSRTFFLVTAATILLAACIAPDGPLPSSVYYLAGRADEAQVWRLEADGTTVVRVTQEEGGVDDFSVSPSDGRLAFISDGGLFLQDDDGQNRRLIADLSQVDEAVRGDPFRGVIDSPVFSPDGRTLAYALNGLHLYNVDTREDRHILTNLGNLLGESFVFAKEAYYPGPWSPDGSRLLIVMGYFEGSTLAIMEPGALQPFHRLRSDGPVCCQWRWTRDGRSVLVANPSYGTAEPGLWRFASDTGSGTTVVAGVAEDGSMNFVGWPHQLTSGDLAFFHNNLPRIDPDVGIPLYLTQSAPDGSELTRLRPEEFHVVDALWTADGSQAVIAQRGDDGRSQLDLVPTDGGPIQGLAEGDFIWRLAWGP